MTGTRAALPPDGWTPPRSIVAGSTQVTVRFEGGGGATTFECGRWPVAPALRQDLMEGFAAATAQDGTHHSLATARHDHLALGRFAADLAQLDHPPTRASELTPAHIAAFRLARRSDYSGLRTLLSRVPNLREDTTAALASGAGPHPSTLAESFSKAEFAAVMTAARADLRIARDRIHERRKLLEQWRAGEVEPGSPESRRAQLLDQVDRTNDLPRYERNGRVIRFLPGFASPGDLLSSFFLTADELVSAGILLVCLTGHNLAGVSALTVAHQRADGHTPGHTASAIVDVVKPRRGRRRRYMTVALADVPDWIAQSSGGRDGLNTAFGVFSLLVDLGHEARTRAGTDRLLVARAVTGGFGTGRHWVVGLSDKGITPRWAALHGLQPAGLDGALTVSWRRLRLSYVQLHQRGVAHTDAVLVGHYLSRDRRTYDELRRVVADVLAEQEVAARQLGVMHTLTAADIAAFDDEPQAVADRLGLDVAVLRDLVDGRRDTVLAACVDELHSPFSPHQQPCEASFLLCTACPNARAAPTHLPAQALAHHQLLALRVEMQPDLWARRFGPAVARLGQVLSRYPMAQIEQARADATDEVRSAVARLVAGELESS